MPLEDSLNPKNQNGSGLFKTISRFVTRRVVDPCVVDPLIGRLVGSNLWFFVDQCATDVSVSCSMTDLDSSLWFYGYLNAYARVLDRMNHYAFVELIARAKLSVVVSI